MSDERIGYPPKGEHKNLVAVFSSERIPLLDMFTAKDCDTWPQSGIHVLQHPDGGVLLCALDGHNCCMVHDPNGWARRPVNFFPSRDMVKHCRMQTRGRSLRRMGLELPAKGLCRGLATLFSSPFLTPEYAEFIQPRAVDEEPYPNITTFMAKAAQATPADINDMGLAASSFALLAKAGAGHLRVRAGGGVEGPLFVADPNLPRVLFCIMPTKVSNTWNYDEEKEELPLDSALEWLQPGMEAWAKAEQARIKATQSRPKPKTRKAAPRLAKAA